MRKKSLSGLCVAAFIIMVAVSSHASIIFSENFNDATVSGSPLVSNSEKWNLTNYYAALLTSDTQWLLINQVFVAENGNSPTDKAILLNENPFGFMITSAPISGLVAGTTYFLTFDHWGDNRSGGTYGFSVLINGTPLSAITRTYGIPGPGATVSIPFTAPTNSINLSFTATSSIQEASPIIDNISISNIPIPASAWLLGAGLIGLFGLRRKFRK